MSKLGRKKGVQVGGRVNVGGGKCNERASKGRILGQCKGNSHQQLGAGLGWK